jgi:anti-sigma B factor antagonist
MLLHIEERRFEPDITELELAGRLALGQESQRVENLADGLLQEGRIRLILDMSGVEHIDSAGVGMVALVSGRMKEAGGKLVVVAPEGKVLSLLKLTQISTLVTICATLAEAVAAFG